MSQSALVPSVGDAEFGKVTDDVAEDAPDAVNPADEEVDDTAAAEASTGETDAAEEGTTSEVQVVPATSAGDIVQEQPQSSAVGDSEFSCEVGRIVSNHLPWSGKHVKWSTGSVLLNPAAKTATIQSPSLKDPVVIDLGARAVGMRPFLLKKPKKKSSWKWKCNSDDEDTEDSEPNSPETTEKIIVLHSGDGALRKQATLCLSDQERFREVVREIVGHEVYVVKNKLNYGNAGEVQNVVAAIVDDDDDNNVVNPIQNAAQAELQQLQQSLDEGLITLQEFNTLSVALNDD